MVFHFTSALSEHLRTHPSSLLLWMEGSRPQSQLSLHRSVDAGNTDKHTLIAHRQEEPWTGERGDGRQMGRLMLARALFLCSPWTTMRTHEGGRSLKWGQTAIKSTEWLMRRAVLEPAGVRERAESGSITSSQGSVKNPHKIRKELNEVRWQSEHRNKDGEAVIERREQFWHGNPDEMCWQGFYWPQTLVVGMYSALHVCISSEVVKYEWSFC